jgi:dihydrofolate synthase/folylpolyglutamate synthase
MEIQHVTAFLYALKPKGIRFGLENTRLVLEKLGTPQENLKVVHLAGSNGKGSTAAFLDSVLRRTGRRVGLYTSPHLNHFRERFRINGQPVTDREVCAAAGRLLEEGLDLDPREVVEWVEREGMVDKMGSETWYQERGGASDFTTLTFFECTTVLSVLLFAQAGLDVTLMECGMGGRLDATNVLEPLVSVILPIHLEHTEWLGDTLEAIAGEKAGIIKPGVPVVCARQAPEAFEVISARAAELGAPLISFGREFDAEGGWREANFRTGKRSLGPVKLGLPGAHQVENAAIALACLPQLEKHGIRANDAETIAGLSQVDWPARFERFGTSGEWIIDAAHNPAGAQVLADTIRDVFPGEKIRLVFGVLGDKRAEEMLEFLAPLASGIDLVRSKDARARDPQTLLPLIPGSARVHSSVEAAIEQLWSEPGGSVVICGSLTVAGEARAYLEGKGASPWSQGGEPARKAG